MQQLLKKSMNRENLLILYFPLDDPIVKSPYDLLDIYIRHGVRIIEIALPVENPVLDGKVIRDSMARVLSNTTQKKFFEDIKSISRKYPELKIQLMAYYDQIRKITIEKFAELVQDAGISYVLSPDATVGQQLELEAAFHSYSIPVIQIAPCILEEKDLKMLSHSDGYIFQRSSNGKTGESHALSDELGKNIKLLRDNHILLPVVLAFGISDKYQIESAMSMGFDGVVIGSALFLEIQNNSVEKYLKDFDQWFVKPCGKKPVKFK